MGREVALPDDVYTLGVNFDNRVRARAVGGGRICNVGGDTFFGKKAYAFEWSVMVSSPV